MDGTLVAASVPGDGSTFTIELERAEPVAVQRTSSDDDAVMAVRDYGREQVLLYVEDTVANVQLIEGILDRRPSVRLIPAMLGQLGLDLAHEHRPDLILLDMHLPDIPGEDVLARLSANAQTRDIPVVVLSADAKRDRETVLAAGARAYLTKPIAMRALLETLDEVLAPAAVAR